MMERSFIVIALLMSAVSASLKPRGVDEKNLSLYRPDQPFQCFDKSKTYSFEHVNDDYCDCPDGSDEPGTSACPNGRFYCPNVGHRPKYISSMFVDDGVCDCCDGSDEQRTPGGESPCQNSCESLGRIAREAAERRRATMEQGHTLYKDYVSKYEAEIAEKREKLKSVEASRATADDEKKRLQTTKEEVEKLESEAKDTHQKAWDEQKKVILEQRDRQRAELAFDELDADQDGSVSTAELQHHLEFDVDGDGVVSDDEARENLEDPPNGAADRTHFHEKVWPHIKEVYRRPGSEHDTATAAPTEEPATVPSLPDEEEDEEEERRAEERLKEFRHRPHGRHHDNSREDHAKKHDDGDDADLKMPEYPEETKRLMDAADQARNAYEDARKAYDELDREYSELLSVTATDFGAAGEYYALRGQCFELEDREYVYKLCPFDRAAQKQKHGHHETSLGRFEAWRADATSGNKYAVQAYTNGEGCWNGPARSVAVKVQCGGENKLLTVSEPNRCEYAMDFATPAACSVPPPPIDHHSFWDHTEL